MLSYDMPFNVNYFALYIVSLFRHIHRRVCVNNSEQCATL